MIDKDILNIMGCIRCKSKLIDKENHLECPHCNIGFPVEDDVMQPDHNYVFSFPMEAIIKLLFGFLGFPVFVIFFGSPVQEKRMMMKRIEINFSMPFIIF